MGPSKFEKSTSFLFTFSVALSSQPLSSCFSLLPAFVCFFSDKVLHNLGFAYSTCLEVTKEPHQTPTHHTCKGAGVLAELNGSHYVPWKCNVKQAPWDMSIKGMEP